MTFPKHQTFFLFNHTVHTEVEDVTVRLKTTIAAPHQANVDAAIASVLLEVKSISLKSKEGH